MRRVIMIAAGTVTAMVVIGFLIAWLAGQENGMMSDQGWLALGIGIVVTAALGGGLMTLVFYSDRAGYDEAASEVGSGPDDQPKQ